MRLNDKDTLSIAAAVSDVLEGKKQVQEMDPKKHVKKDEDSGMFCVYNTAGKKVKEFKSKDEAEKYAIDNHDDLMSEADEPRAKGEKDFKAAHKVKKSGEKEDGSVVKEDVKKEGNAFTKALMAARKAGDDTFVVAGKEYKCEDYDKDEDEDEDLEEKADADTVAMIKANPKMKDKVLKSLNPKSRKAVIKALEEETIEEGKFPKALVKKATDLALKMSGNMTGAVKKIEKMKKGLSDDAEVKAALQMANEEVSEEVVAEAHAMNEAKSKMQEDKERYQKFFKAALKKFGVTSPGELEGDKKKEFFDYVDKNYEADNESD